MTTSQTTAPSAEPINRSPGLRAAEIARHHERVRQERRAREEEASRQLAIDRAVAEAEARAERGPATREVQTRDVYRCPRCERPLALDHFPRRDDAEIAYRLDLCIRCLRVNEIEFDFHPLGPTLQSLALEVWNIAADLNGGATRQQIESALKRARRRKYAVMPTADDIDYIIHELVIHEFAIDVWGRVFTVPAASHMNPPKTP